MTDLERFIELYKSFGIDLVPENDVFNNLIYVSFNHQEHLLFFYASSRVNFTVDGKFMYQCFEDNDCEDND